MKTSIHRWLQCNLVLGAVVLGLGACGGGSSGSTASNVSTQVPDLPGSLVDTVSYSMHPDASLVSAIDSVASTSHSINLNGLAFPYTASAGHLTAKAGGSGRDQASFFYVAYTANHNNQSAATRPITFFYNGGPGSASIWLHLGSYGPKRLMTGMPATTLPRPFALVDNAESLLDVSDLVFVDAVGTGLSQAIAPFTNRSFWGVDSDALVFRDFIQTYVNVHARQTSPKYLFGESYGGPRTALLAGLLETAGVRLTGLVLQAPAMNYNSNCGVIYIASLSCAGYLPSYAATGHAYQLNRPLVGDFASFMAQMRDFSAQRYAPAVTAVIGGANIPAELPPLLRDYTGLVSSAWQNNFNMRPSSFRSQLIPGTVIGRYDARVSAPLGSELAREGDPSSTIIDASFLGAMNSYLRDDLRYRSTSTYTIFSGAIESWDFRHADKDLPDTIPDLGAALALNPQLRVLAINGYHDLATPFYQTEQDLARLNMSTRVLVRNYAGGHMTYLDDASRAAAKADLLAFYRGSLTGVQAANDKVKDYMPAPQAPHTSQTWNKASAPIATEITLNPTAELLSTSLRDPWVPPTLRPILPPPPASQGQVLQSEIKARVSELRQRRGNLMPLNSGDEKH